MGDGRTDFLAGLTALHSRHPTRTGDDVTIYGANPEQLTQLGQTLSAQIDVLHQLVSTVDRTVNSTTWQGPARQRFEQDWSGSFKQALIRLEEAFGAAGRDCVARAEELRRIMGA